MDQTNPVNRITNVDIFYVYIIRVLVIQNNVICNRLNLSKIMFLYSTFKKVLLKGNLKIVIIIYYLL